MTLKDIEDEMRRLNNEAQKRGHATPFKVDCYELVELADALAAERERIEALFCNCDEPTITTGLFRVCLVCKKRTWQP